MRFPLSDQAISSISLPRKRDIETLRRGGLRRIGFRPKFRDFFLSGEVIENYCDYTLLKDGEFSEVDRNAIDSSVPLRIFLKSDLLPRLLEILPQVNSKFKRHSLFLHNSDVSHELGTLLYALETFDEIFLTNWLGNHPRIHAIPIGLENQIYMRNGVQQDYVRLRRLGLPSYEERPISILSSFNILTNDKERRQAANFARDINGGLILGNEVPPKNYRRLVANSRYVLSPPGNGPDCHRTWEAIYLGAIPIVKKSSWPNFDFQPPVVLVDDWSEITKIVRNQTLPECSNSDWQSDFWRTTINE